MHIYIYTCIHIYIHTYIHTYIHAYIHTYIHTYLYTYIRKYIQTYMHACMHAHIHTDTNINTYVRIPIYIYTHIRMYIHTYIHTYNSRLLFFPLALQLFCYLRLSIRRRCWQKQAEESVGGYLHQRCILEEGNMGDVEQAVVSFVPELSATIFLVWLSSLCLSSGVDEHALFLIGRKG